MNLSYEQMNTCLRDCSFIALVLILQMKWRGKIAQIQEKSGFALMCQPAIPVNS